ncbi:MAG TPA: chemotaxis protein CheB, partial [Segetibacter sp.]
IIKDGEIQLGNGPAENRWRPSIDVLFRSAAAHYSNRVIGIVLTGFLNDGVAGMSAIKRSGGFTIVQDPDEAEYPDMPLAVLDNMEVDYTVSLLCMKQTIQAIIDTNKEQKAEAPPEVVRESEIAENVAISIDGVEKLGAREFIACPDCGGGLWGIESDDIKRYRCHIGHSYTEKDLIIRQAESLESTLWVALRMMEERRGLFRKIANSEKIKGLYRLSAENLKRAEALEEHIDKLKKVLFSTKRV